jgi:hypothetical protein
MTVVRRIAVFRGVIVSIGIGLAAVMWQRSVLDLNPAPEAAIAQSVGIPVTSAG